LRKTGKSAEDDNTAAFLMGGRRWLPQILFSAEREFVLIILYNFMGGKD
jgi:hypothetical protein